MNAGKVKTHAEERFSDRSTTLSEDSTGVDPNYYSRDSGTSGFRISLHPIERGEGIPIYAEHKFNILKKVSSLQQIKSSEKLKIQDCLSLAFNTTRKEDEAKKVKESFKAIKKAHKKRKTHLRNICRILDQIAEKRARDTFSSITDKGYHQRQAILNFIKTQESRILLHDERESTVH